MVVDELHHIDEVGRGAQKGSAVFAVAVIPTTEELGVAVDFTEVVDEVRRIGGPHLFEETGRDLTENLEEMGNGDCILISARVERLTFELVEAAGRKEFTLALGGDICR